MENEEIKRTLVICTAEMEFAYKGKQGEEGYGSISGFGTTYGNVDWDGDTIEPGAFEYDIKSHRESGIVPHMFYNHDPNEPVGNWVRLGDTNKGIKFDGGIAVGRQIPKAEQAHICASSNTMKGLSLGFAIAKGGARFGDGKANSPNRFISKGRMVECSIVPFPKDTKSIITDIKGALAEKETITIREAEEILRDVGNFSGNAAKTFISKLCKGYNLTRDAEILAAQNADRIQQGLLQLITGLKK